MGNKHKRLRKCAGRILNSDETKKEKCTHKNRVIYSIYILKNLFHIIYKEC